MNEKEIASKIDHTLLKPTATTEQIKKLCDEAVAFQTASVCIPPYYVKTVKDLYGEKLNICTVIGFPLGYNTADVKAFEAEQAVKNGASEIDMVINQGLVKENRFDEVTKEIALVKKACGKALLKVIIETCNLNDIEIKKLCDCVTEAKADYIKTSTGFGSEGANFHVVEIMAQNIGKDVKIKAAGGIKSRADMEAFIQLGCSRLGTSSGIQLLYGEKQ